MGKKRYSWLFSLVLAAFLIAPPASAQTKIDYYFPAQVQGPNEREMENIVKKFNDMQDDVEVVPVYTGRYSDTMIKARAAFKAGSTEERSVGKECVSQYSSRWSQYHSNNRQYSKN